MNYIKINRQIYDIETLSFDDYKRLTNKSLSDFVKDGGKLDEPIIKPLNDLNNAIEDHIETTIHKKRKK